MSTITCEYIFTKGKNNNKICKVKKYFVINYVKNIIIKQQKKL
jgi:hypothetical protein